jgi:hypothetical protein
VLEGKSLKYLKCKKIRKIELKICHKKQEMNYFLKVHRTKPFKRKLKILNLKFFFGLKKIGNAISSHFYYKIASASLMLGGLYVT